MYFGSVQSCLFAAGGPWRAPARCSVPCVSFTSDQGRSAALTRGVAQVKHKLDEVLQQVVEEDESRLVQEQARVLLRAIMVSALV